MVLNTKGATWKPAFSGEVPIGALDAGFQGGQKMWSCRAFHKSEQLPGRRFTSSITRTYSKHISSTQENWTRKVEVAL